MKKILFPLVALVCSMSMNAQVMKIMKNGEDTPVQTYKGSDYYVVFEEAEETPAVTTTGTAKRTGDIDVNWVQLWEDGPKFAEYNVGAANNKAEDYGGYYCWGSSIDKDSNVAYKSGSNALSDTDDTATNLWGSNWRMPTQGQFDALIANCDVEWTTINGVWGRKFTGKENTVYASNSVFLPAAGYCDCESGTVYGLGEYGYYWSSTPFSTSFAYCLYFSSGVEVEFYARCNGHPVRAVLAE